MNKHLLTLFLLILLATHMVTAQTTTVTGVVVDATNQGIPGVSVIEKGTTNIAITDAKGSFSINLPNNSTLIITLGGSLTKEIAVAKGQTNLGTIKLQEGGLSNTTTSGYTTTVITGKSLVQSGEPLLVNALQGKIPGANITLNGGEPGAGGFILLRGATSIGNNLQPLMMLDDIPIYNSTISSGLLASVLQSRINDLSTASIDRIEVIRGTAGAAQ